MARLKLRNEAMQWSHLCCLDLRELRKATPEGRVDYESPLGLSKVRKGSMQISACAKARCESATRLATAPFISVFA